MEATGRMPQQKTRLISPMLPVTSQGSRRCLTMKVNAHGQHLGKFIVRDESGNRLYEEQSGSKNMTHNCNVSVRQVTFVLPCSGQVLWECDFLDSFTNTNDFPCEITNVGDSRFILNIGRTNTNNYEFARGDVSLRGKL